ncbi:MAG TPA: hypothetical protein VM911_06965 [Pyrinomonadaceae bacterium]|jgi:hypothetical protein|nr:hypothetical protein [Pyrinomonadaceae bacterium]
MIINLLAATALLIFSPGGAINNSHGMTEPADALLKGATTTHALAMQTPKSESRNTSVWSHSEDGVKLEVRVEGKVEFTDDYTDVRSISEDGLFQIIDEHGGALRKLRITRGANGGLRRTFTIDGHTREFDREAAAWLSKILTEAAREGTLDAQARARRILQQRGVEGVLEEIPRLRTDYARRVYFETLIKEGNLQTEALENVLRKASKQITSDFETARFLTEFARNYLVRQSLIAPFFEAANRIESDYEHGRVLLAVLKSNPNGEVLAGLLESARHISSDYEKARFLIEAAPLYLDNKGLRAAYLETIRSITSDYERGRVLTFVSKQTPLN